jgi:aminoglycoside phosphotransferase (APT) family kinase protein
MLLHEAAQRFQIRVDDLTPLGGATGTVFTVADRVMKLGTAGDFDREILAIGAACRAVPVVEILDRVDTGTGSAILMTRARGTTAWPPEVADPTVAYARGRSCGELHKALAEVPAPDGIPTLADTSGPRALLHLDLHPLNVLMSEAGEVTAVLDWANAAAGPPDYDRARTASILRFDPAAELLRENPLWLEFVRGWADAGQLADLPAEAAEWALRFLGADGASRRTIEEAAWLQMRLAAANPGWNRFSDPRDAR